MVIELCLKSFEIFGKLDIGLKDIFFCVIEEKFLVLYDMVICVVGMLKFVCVIFF